MPNHVTTVIRAASRAVIDALLTEEGVDFGRVIPPPQTEDYKNDSCSHRHWALDGPDPNPTCWSAWNPEHWGTTWNAYSHKVRDGGLELRFETAWNSPGPVIEALSVQFPDVPISVKYADEDFGYNLGEYVICGGSIVSEREFTVGDAEARDFASLLTYGKSHADMQPEWGEDGD